MLLRSVKVAYITLHKSVSRFFILVALYLCAAAAGYYFAHCMKQFILARHTARQAAIKKPQMEWYTWNKMKSKFYINLYVCVYL